MKLSVTDFLRRLSSKPFVVQFVTSLTVGDNEEPITQITFYLIPAESDSEARAAAEEMIDSLSAKYRNSEGETVTSKCIGIHSVDELDYVDDDGRLELGVVQFSRTTRPEHLTQDEREDLLLLDWITSGLLRHDLRRLCRFEGLQAYRFLVCVSEKVAAPGRQRLPEMPEGYYREVDVFPRKVLKKGEVPAGARRVLSREDIRLVLGQNGEVYISFDHYTTFIRLR